MMISYDDQLSCECARLSLYDLLDTETEATVPENVRRHIASCERCRADMSRLKTLLAGRAETTENEQKRKDSVVSTLLSLHFAWIDKPVKCKSAKPFLASLADPLLRITIPTPITVHIDKCRRCSDELSTIRSSNFTHKELCRLGQVMAEQPHEDVAQGRDSQVATCFTFQEPSQQSVQTESNEMYANWPIDVQVLSQGELGSTDTACSTAPKQRALILNLKQRFKKPAIAAAAVIMISFALFFGTSAAKAVDLDQIFGALKSAPNIHVTNSFPGTTKLQQERWVSRSLNMYMLKVGQELTLWDFRAGSRKVKSFHNVAPKAVPLTGADAATAKRIINSPLDIMPFNKMSELPADAKWSRVADDALQAGIPGCEVYDLTWTGRSDRGEAKLRKWRVFVDSNTNLPRKAQFYYKSTTGTEYALQNELVVEYLTDIEVQAAVKEASL